MKRYAVYLLVVLIGLSSFLSACSNQAETKQTELLSKKRVGEIKTDFFELTYDPTVWQIEDDNFVDAKEMASIELRTIAEDADGVFPDIKLSINTEITRPNEFRTKIYKNGFDQYAYIENKSYPTFNIGGVDFLKAEDDHSIHYLARAESAKTTIYMDIKGEVKENAEQIETLLSSLKFTLKDIGNKDTPWPWQGKRFSAVKNSKKFKDFTITSAMIPFDKPLISYDRNNDQAIVVDDDKVYIISDNKLFQYDYEANAELLNFAKEIVIDQKVEEMSLTDDGSLWISRFVEPLTQIKDSKIVKTCSYFSIAPIHPSGSWGISYFGSGEAECEKFNISNEEISAEVTTLDFSSLLDMIMNIDVDQNHIYVTEPTVNNDETESILVCNTEGEIELTLNPEIENFGADTAVFISETENGYIALYELTCEVGFWTKDGEWIGSISGAELFGENVGSIGSAFRLSNGEIFIVITADREDKTAEETVVYKLTGF